MGAATIMITATSQYPRLRPPRSAKPRHRMCAPERTEPACTVRELQDVTNLSQSLVSYHLGELRKAGLVTSTASGRANQYRLSQL